MRLDKYAPVNVQEEMAVVEFMTKKWPNLWDGLTEEQRELVGLGVVLKTWESRGLDQTFDMSK